MSDIRAEIEVAIADYSRVFPVPYSLSVNLKLASRALAVASSVKVETLRAEHDWLSKAHENSAGLQYHPTYRAGFAAAAGWVQLHADLAEYDRDELPDE